MTQPTVQPTPQAGTSPGFDFSGTWHNQLGSRMEVTVTADGGVSGTYYTGAGSPTPEEPFPMTGFVSNDVVAFSVNFGKYGSLTTWTGQAAGAAGAESITTLWHMSVDVPEPNEPKNLWRAIWAGTDTFRRGAPPAGGGAVAGGGAALFATAGAAKGAQAESDVPGRQVASHPLAALRATQG